jgi:hypothetical protein
MTAQEWIIEGHTGISSKTIWSHFVLNKEPKWPSPPSDPSDLLRCYWLLKIAPEWKIRMGEIAERYPEWRGLVDHWSELEQMLEQAWPKSCASGEYEDEPPAKALYKRMKELLA